MLSPPSGWHRRCGFSLLILLAGMTRILIRCDASLLIGSGHVMRCRNLARILQQLGSDVCFICRRQPDLISLLEQEFDVMVLPEQSLKSCDGLDGRDLYSRLGCTRAGCR